MLLTLLVWKSTFYFASESRLFRARLIDSLEQIYLCCDKLCFNYFFLPSMFYQAQFLHLNLIIVFFLFMYGDHVV